MKEKLIIIDGSYGEGGGQILRTSISLSAILGIPVRVKNIRIKRKRPGLRPQHLTGIQAIAKLTRGKLKGDQVGSTTVEFIPKDIIGGEFEFDTGTAGSVTLVTQVLLPIMLFSHENIKVKIKGGTHVAHSPSYDYFKEVLLSAIERMGAKIETDIIKYGFYPKGGGEIFIECSEGNGSKLTGRRFDEGYKNLKQPREIIKGRIVLSDKLPKHIIEREVSAIERLLELKGFYADIETITQHTFSPGNAITLWYNHNGHRGVCSLGKIGKRAEAVAEETATELMKHIGCTIDKHLTDQLMIFSTVAKGDTKIYTSEISSHTKTNAYVINSFLPDTIRITSSNHIEIKGIRSI